MASPSCRDVPVDLLERAQRASRAGVTETVRAGLRELVTADAFEQLIKMRGKVKFGATWQELKGKEPPSQVRGRAATRKKRRSWRRKERGK
jgi:hypothetical protein